MWVKKSQIQLLREESKLKILAGIKSSAMWIFVWIIVFIFGYDYRRLTYNLIKIEDLVFVFASLVIGLIIFYAIGYKFDWVRTDFRTVLICIKCEKIYTKKEAISNKCDCGGQVYNVKAIKWIDHKEVEKSGEI